ILTFSPREKDQLACPPIEGKRSLSFHWERRTRKRSEGNFSNPLGRFFLSRVTIDRILRPPPGVPASGNVAHVGESFRFQNAGGDTAAISTGAVNRCRLRLIQFA